MGPFHSGIGVLAQNLRVPIVPVRLAGVWQMTRERRRLARMGEITIRIGAPITFAPGARPETIAIELEQAVAAL
jgi:long-chain acyl-CoA synthetase